jgi:hypothetical protein
MLLSVCRIYAGQATLEVVAPRPAAETIVMLSEQLQCVITYEDPAFQFKNDLKETYPGSTHFVPKGGTISYTYKKSNANIDILRGFINEYNEKKMQEFDVVQDNEIYNVFPVRIVNRDGQWKENFSPLDTPVTLSLKDTDCYEALTALCSAISQADNRYSISTNNISVPLLMTARLSLYFADVPARYAMNAILSALNKRLESVDSARQLTWHLLFDPQPAPTLNYILNFQTVTILPADHFMRLRIVDQRPVALAAKLLEKRFNTIITYEDPPYVCDCDIMGNESGKTLAGGILDMAWKQNHSVDDVLRILTETPVIPRAVPDAFKVSRENGRYRIYPNMSRDKQGNPVSVSPVMDRDVSLNIAEADGLDVVRLICSKLSDSIEGRIVFEVGDMPGIVAHTLKSRNVLDFSIVDQKAYNALNQFLEKNDLDISWQLLFDPASEKYNLILQQLFE